MPLNPTLPVSFIWPVMLWGLITLPLLVVAYLWLLRRRKQSTLRFAHLGLVREALGRRGAWRRHVPPLLLLFALALLLVASARPTAVISLPLQQETIVLAMDVSGSMRATDVRAEPAGRIPGSGQGLHRCVAAQRAGWRSSPSPAPPPWCRRRPSVARTWLRRSTASSCSAAPRSAAASCCRSRPCFPEAGIDLSQITGQRAMPPDPSEKPKQDFVPVQPGSYRSAAVILLTDGQRTTGPDPIEAARMAADRGIKVYTVGIGTKEGETIGFEGWSMRVRLDEDTLKEIANTTRADYYYAGSADDLKKVYQGLGTRLAVEKKETEITALLAAVGALLVVLAAGLSVWWFGRVA